MGAERIRSPLCRFDEALRPGRALKALYRLRAVQTQTQAQLGGAALYPPSRKGVQKECYKAKKTFKHQLHNDISQAIYSVFQSTSQTSDQ